MANLPAQLTNVPEDQRLPEALGVGFGGVGLGALIVFAGYCIMTINSGLLPDTWKFLAGSLVVGGGGIAMEIVRRRKPLTLVPQGDEVGVYKDGQRVGTFPTRQLTLYKLSFVNTFRELTLFGMCGLVTSFGALGMTFSGDSRLVTWMWGLAIALDALAYSSVLTRIMSKQYYLPKNFASGAVAFRKSALVRVGWSH